METPRRESLIRSLLESNSGGQMSEQVAAEVIFEFAGSAQAAGHKREAGYASGPEGREDKVGVWERSPALGAGWAMPEHAGPGRGAPPHGRAGRGVAGVHTTHNTPYGTPGESRGPRACQSGEYTRTASLPRPDPRCATVLASGPGVTSMVPRHPPGRTSIGAAPFATTASPTPSSPLTAASGAPGSNACANCGTTSTPLASGAGRFVFGSMPA